MTIEKLRIKASQIIFKYKQARYLSMKNLGKTTLQISNQGLGCMSMSEFYGKPLPDDQAFKLFNKAYELGINFFDTADMYGCGDNERLVGEVVTNLINDKNANRENLLIASKCGIVRDAKNPHKRGVDNSYGYIKTCCQKSLKRLDGKHGQIKYIDLYYLHRLNGQNQIDEAMKAMAELLAEGKIKAVGLSEANTQLITLANKALLKHSNHQHQISAVQSEYSLLTRVAQTSGVLDLCEKLNISFIAYSPLSRALLTGEISASKQFPKDDFRQYFPRFQGENLQRNMEIVNQVKKLAQQKQCTTAQIALAWVLHQKNITPIPGTTKEANLMTNVAAENIHFSHDDLAHLNQLEEAKGLRYRRQSMHDYGLGHEIN